MQVLQKFFFVFSQNSFESGCDHVVVFTQQLLTKYTHYIQHVSLIYYTLYSTCFALSFFFLLSLASTGALYIILCYCRSSNITRLIGFLLFTYLTRFAIFTRLTIFYIFTTRPHTNVLVFTVCHHIVKQDLSREKASDTFNSGRCHHSTVVL